MPDAAMLERVRRMPKVELHVHLEGSLEPALLWQLAARNRLDTPFHSVEELEALFRFSEFNGFIRSLLFGVACLRTPEDFHEAVLSLQPRLVEDNIRYAEITWTPQFYLERPGGLDAILAAMNAARAEIRQATGIEIAWIPDLVRSRPQAARRAAQWLFDRDRAVEGIVALGLGGPEAGHPADPFADVFAQARQRNLPANPHAGESAGPEAIWSTIRALRPARIGHGVRAVEDGKLLDYLARARLPLEVSLTSNVRLGVCDSHATHPVRELIDAGCIVTLNTDDPALFRTTLSEEYLLAVEQCGLTLPELYRMNIDGLRAGYLETEQRRQLMTAFREHQAAQDGA
jgi:adenosine deaminase